MIFSWQDICYMLFLYWYELQTLNTCYWSLVKANGEKHYVNICIKRFQAKIETFYIVAYGKMKPRLNQCISIECMGMKPIYFYPSDIKILWVMLVLCKYVFWNFAGQNQTRISLKTMLNANWFFEWYHNPQWDRTQCLLIVSWTP